MCRLFYTPSPSVQAVIQKKSGFDTPADLGEPPREAGSIKGLVLRTWMLVASIWGELIPPRGHGCWPALFWGPPSNPSEPGVYLTTRGLVSVSGLPGPHSQPSWDPAPPTGEPDATPWGRTTYATGGGPAPLEHPHCSQAHQTEGCIQPTGGTLGAFNSWSEGSELLGPRGCITSSTYLIHKNKHRELAKWGDRGICSKEGPRQNPRRSKWSGNNESSWQRAQGNGQKDAQWIREKNRRSTENFNQELESINSEKNQIGLKNTIAEIKNTLEGIISRSDGTEKWIRKDSSGNHWSWAEKEKKI